MASQSQRKEIESPRRQRLALLTADIYDPRPAVLFEAEWVYIHASGENADAARCWAAQEILAMVEEKFQPALTAFYRIRKKTDSEGKCLLPDSAIRRARTLKVMKPIRP